MKTTISVDGLLTTITIEGLVTPAEIIDSLLDFYGTDYTPLLLWDFSRADLSRLDRHELDKIVPVARDLSFARREGKTAAVTSRTVDYGVCRMYQILAEIGGHPVPQAVFETVNEARVWLLASN